MGELVNLDDWKKENSRAVHRKEKYRSSRTGVTTAVNLEERKLALLQERASKESAEKIAQERIATYVYDIARGTDSWRDPNCNVERWKTRHSSNTPSELWAMLEPLLIDFNRSSSPELPEIEAAMKHDVSSVAKIIENNPIHYGVAAHMYLEKIRPEYKKVPGIGEGGISRKHESPLPSSELI